MDEAALAYRDTLRRLGLRNLSTVRAQSRGLDQEAGNFLRQPLNMYSAPPHRKNSSDEWYCGIFSNLEGTLFYCKHSIYNMMNGTFSIHIGDSEMSIEQSQYYLGISI